MLKKIFFTFTIISPDFPSHGSMDACQARISFHKINKCCLGCYGWRLNKCLSRARCESKEKKKLHLLHFLHLSTTATATAILWGDMPKNRHVLFIPRCGIFVPGRGNVCKAPLPVTMRVQEVQEVQVEKCD